MIDATVADEVVEKLKEYSFLVRKILSQKVMVKFLPKILFRKDESFEYALDFYKDYDRDGQTLSARISYEESEDDELEDIEDFASFPLISESILSSLPRPVYQYTIYNMHYWLKPFWLHCLLSRRKSISVPCLRT